MRRNRFPNVVQRQQLLAAAREFRPNPNNKSAARLLMKVATQFDRELYVRRWILTDAGRLTKRRRRQAGVSQCPTGLESYLEALGTKR